jgi:hypothetical protein
MDDTRFDAPASCLGQTCLSWQSDGELSPEDHQLVLDRLRLADGCAAGSRECLLIKEGFVNGDSICRCWDRSYDATGI